MKPIAVDLGLSVRWADRNLGAEEIFQIGTPFIPSGRSRTMEEEVAIINDYIKTHLGGKWRLPTMSEVWELQKSCKIWPAKYKQFKDPMDQKKGYNLHSIYKVKGKNGRYCYFNDGYHLIAGNRSESALSVRPAIWELNNCAVYYPFYNERREVPVYYQNEAWYGKDYIPYGYYYKNGIPVRPVTDELPSGRDKFIRFFEYNTMDGDDVNIEVAENKGISFYQFEQYRRVIEEVSDEQKRERYYERCEEKSRREEREQREYEERQREKHRNESQYNDFSDRYLEREIEMERRYEEEQRKQERLEDWYREYVTIDVDLEFHCMDSEYNQDYWDYRNHEIRVSRREAMALIEAGEDAIISRAGYHCRRSLIRNVSYQIPYGLYDRP